MCSQFTIFVYFFSGASCLFRGAPDSRFFILSCCMHVLLSNFLILSQPASCCDLYTYIVNWGLGGANVTPKWAGRTSDAVSPLSHEKGALSGSGCFEAT